MKVGIIGTRGVPNRYGGFEQFAEYLSLGLVDRGHDVYVYNSSLHPHKSALWRGVHLIHCYDPEDKIGTAGQFVYDLNCIWDARTRGFDVLLQLGYTSSSVWGRLLPRSAVIFTNMDGLEWKRSKYGGLVKRFLRHAEKWAVRTSDFLIADSIGIQDYLRERYKTSSTFIPYGAEVLLNSKGEMLKKFDLSEFNYYMLIARMEPENNIETILDGYVLSGDSRTFLVVGKTENSFGQRMLSKFSSHKNIRFIGAIYDTEALDQLRHYSRLYFHGHSVGGTNPSLLEAMGAGAMIAAHDNPFNRSVLGSNAYYFSDSRDISKLLDADFEVSREKWISQNRERIATEYSWAHIIDQYETLFAQHLSPSE